MKVKLPEVCVRCRQLKLAHLGQRTASHARYGHSYWVCHACLGAPKRRLRTKQESFMEREALRTLREFCPFKMEAEYKLGPYIYDLAIPMLRLLIELDSKSFHLHPWAWKRDKKKAQFALSHQWALVHVRAPVNKVGLICLQNIRKRAEVLGFEDFVR